MATYQGHKNWNYWNVSLWIANDEPLYRIALRCIHRSRGLNAAAEYMMSELTILGHSVTPDGAPYTKSSVRAALKGLS